MASRLKLGQKDGYSNHSASIGFIAGPARGEQRLDLAPAKHKTRVAIAVMLMFGFFSGVLSAQPSLQITSPTNGTVVNPGQTLVVK